MPLSRNRSPRHRTNRSRSRSRTPSYRKKSQDYHRRSRSRSPHHRSSTHTKRPQSSSSYHHSNSSSSHRKPSTSDKRLSQKGSPKRHGSRSPVSKHETSSSHKAASSKVISSSQRRETSGREYPPLDKIRRSRSLSPPRSTMQTQERISRDPREVAHQKWDPLYSSARPVSPHRTPYDDYSRQRSPSPDYRDSRLLFPASQNVGIEDLSMVYPSDLRVSLGERFNDLEDEVRHPPIIEENITIGIHRKGPSMRHDPDTPIKRGYNSRIPLMIHRKDEGRRGIFDREEIKVFHHDDVLDDDIFEEKRTISVHQKRGRSHQTRDYADKRIIQRPDSRKIIGSHRSSRTEVTTTSPKIKFDPRPDPRYESLFKTEEKIRIDYQSKSVTDKIHRNPDDLRHSLLKRRHDDDKEESQFDARKKIEAKRKESERRKDSRSGDGHRSSDRRSRDGGQERNRSSDGRKNSSDLPDFSNRPGRKNPTDKFQSVDWQDKPEMIPKNPMYYEHDNREDDSSSFRGRGGYRNRPFRSRGFRGGYQGSNYRGSNYRGSNYRSSYRGSSSSFSTYKPRGFRRPYGSNTFGRGSYKGTGHYSDRRSHDTWKHDKYDDVKDDNGKKDSSKEKDRSKTDREEKEDNRPTSTT